MPVTPLCCKAEPWQVCEPSLDPTVRLSSSIDNLFLRSCLALDWITFTMGLVSLPPGVKKPEPRRKRRGRPTDTDADRDRRIDEAWRTGRYTSLEDLGRAFGMTKTEVRRARDRHRSRCRKPSSGKRGQEP
jgi:hypothetical protein